MKSILFTICLITIYTFALAQNDNTTQSDEFKDPSSLANWKRFHETENFPNKIKTLKIEPSGNGLLVLEPEASGWYADYQAPFIYKELHGNFDVRCRVRVRGKSAAIPQADWSLAGLMIRQSKRTTSENWQPRQENWLFLTTGVAEPLNVPVFETKTTNNSMSNLKLRPADSGWVELRIIRSEATFLLLYRYDNKDWTLLERFYRPLLPPVVQVGLNAYSGWNSINPDLKKDPSQFNKTLDKNGSSDLVLEVDYFRVSSPKINFQALQLVKPVSPLPYLSPGNQLSDFSITNEQILKAIE